MPHAVQQVDDMGREKQTPLQLQQQLFINHLKYLSYKAPLPFPTGLWMTFYTVWASFGENNVSLTKPRGLLRLYLWWQLGLEAHSGSISLEDAGKQEC